MPPAYGNNGFDLEVLRGQPHLDPPHYPHYQAHYEIENNNEMMFMEAASNMTGDSYHNPTASVTSVDFHMSHEMIGGQFEDHVHPQFTS